MTTEVQSPSEARSLLPEMQMFPAAANDALSRRRRKLRFSLNDLLFLTTLFGAMLGLLMQVPELGVPFAAFILPAIVRQRIVDGNRPVRSKSELVVTAIVEVTYFSMMSAMVLFSLCATYLWILAVAIQPMSPTVGPWIAMATGVLVVASYVAFLVLATWWAE